MGEVFKPNGLNSWRNEDWNRFAQSVEKWETRKWRGSFGSAEVIVIAGVAMGMLEPEVLVNIYGNSAISMIQQWGDDVDSGIYNPQYDKFGINDLEFVSSTLSHLKDVVRANGDK